jgi:hypothetical protein
MLSALLKVKLGSSGGLSSCTKLITFETYVQCLFSIPFLRRALNKGTFGLNSSNYYLTLSAIFITPVISLSLIKRIT